MKRFAFAVPGDLTAPTGGYAYDRRMIAELGRLGWQVEHVALGEGFPFPDETVRAGAEARLLAVAEGCPIVVDGLAFGVLPETAARLSARHPLVALVHHPLALESGLTPARAAAFRASERAALSMTRAVIVTSAATARTLTADYGVPSGRIVIVLPGTDQAPFARGSGDGVVRLLSVGAVVRRKGFDVLIAALARLTDLPWRLTIAGDRGRDAQAVAQLDKDIARYVLGDRVAVTGAVSPDRLGALYAEADVFALASRFEGYGMAYAEAIAHGLPVIGTNAGAIPDTVPADAGLLVPPGDVDALAHALRRMIANETERRNFAAAARAAASQLPTWPDSARIFSRTLEALA